MTAVYAWTFVGESPRQSALFLLSDEGQAVLGKYELLPVLSET